VPVAEDDDVIQTLAPDGADEAFGKRILPGELKDELGLDHFEGRGWRGFHHHASLCIAAYAFLAAERLAHFPLSPSPSSAPLVYPSVSRRGALPVRPERHAPHSIATMYRLLAWTLARGRPCLACGHQPQRHLVTQ
jgi:hypothetical protein